MSKKLTEFDKRMQNYKYTSDQSLMRRTPVIIQIDGMHFHTFTKGLDKPFDEILVRSMQDTTKYLCENIQGCVLAYTQSDEINLLLIDYQELDSQAWFDNRIQKLTSAAASLATLEFNRKFAEHISIMNSMSYEKSYDNEEERTREAARYLKRAMASGNGATFAACAFNLPQDEVTNFFYWRQQDAIRNSIQMVGQANFSHTELQHKSCEDIKQMLRDKSEATGGTIKPWEDYPLSLQRGTCCIKKFCDHEGYEPVKDNGKKIGDIRCETYRSYLDVDKNVPIFKGDGRNYIDKLVYLDEEE